MVLNPMTKIFILYFCMQLQWKEVVPLFVNPQKDSFENHCISALTCSTLCTYTHWHSPFILTGQEIRPSSATTTYLIFFFSQPPYRWFVFFHCVANMATTECDKCPACQCEHHCPLQPAGVSIEEEGCTNWGTAWVCVQVERMATLLTSLSLSVPLSPDFYRPSARSLSEKQQF